jgi:hypothetical protein
MMSKIGFFTRIIKIAVAASPVMMFKLSFAMPNDQNPVIHVYIGFAPIGSNEELTIAILENKSDQLPIPLFSELFQFTVGELFSWLET